MQHSPSASKEAGSDDKIDSCVRDDDEDAIGEQVPAWDRVPETTRWERWAYYFY